MKKSLILGLMLCAATVMAGQIKTAPGFGPFNVGTGGEFSVQVVQYLGANLGQYDSETKNFWSNNPANRKDGTFQTFCIERGVPLSGNVVYDAELSQNISTENRSLTLAAAWLYMQFAKGTLAKPGPQPADPPVPYPYTDYATRASVGGAGEVQNALWTLMGFTADASPYVAVANAAVTLLGLDPDAANDGYFPVAVLQLTLDGEDGSKINRQDILILTGVPDGGLTLSLLGMGLASLGFFSRRNRK